jgi:hypothetical protein
MNYSIKTYLIALALTFTAFSIYSAEIDPKILEESMMDAVLHQSQLAEREAKATREAIERSRRETRKPIAISEDEQLALALAISEKETRQSQIAQQARGKAERERKDKLAASETLAKKLEQEEQKRRDALVASEMLARDLQEQEKKHQQEIRDRAAAQRLKEQDDKEHKEAEQKKKEADELKRAAENPIRGFTTVFHPVHPQEGASCGLHSIDNGNKCYQAVKSGKSIEELQRLLMTGLSDAAQTVKKRDMLDLSEINNIALNTLNMNSLCFTVLENITQSRDELLNPLPRKTDVTYVPDTLGAAIQALRTQARATHIFVIGDMKISRNEAGKLIGHDDHWIAIVADKKDGMVTFHYMCTGGGKHEGIVKTLQEIIEHGNYHGMQLAILLEQYSLRNIDRTIDGGSYGDAINRLNDRINLARKAGVINDARFPKQGIIQLLEGIKGVAHEPYKKQAQELLNKLR